MAVSTEAVGQQRRRISDATRKVMALIRSDDQLSAAEWLAVLDKAAKGMLTTVLHDDLEQMNQSRVGARPQTS